MFKFLIVVLSSLASPPEYVVENEIKVITCFPTDADNVCFEPWYVEDADRMNEV